LVRVKSRFKDPNLIYNGLFIMFTNNLKKLRVIMTNIGQLLNVDLVINLVINLVIINLLVNYWFFDN
jgi:hypothetical protein